MHARTYPENAEGADAGILGRFPVIHDVFRRDVVGRYSKYALELLERECGPDAIRALLSGLLPRTPQVQSSDHLLEILTDENQWTHGFLYIYVTTHVRRILRNEKKMFAPRLASLTLNPDRDRKAFIANFCTMDAILDYIERINVGFTSLTTIKLDRKYKRRRTLSGKSRNYMFREYVRRTKADYRQELVDAFGEELSEHILHQDCLLTQEMIKQTPVLFNKEGFCFEDPHPCEGLGESCCRYALHYPAQSGLAAAFRAAMEWLNAPNTLNRLRLDALERDIILAERETEVVRSLRSTAPEALVDALVRGMSIPSRKVNATVLFCDLQGFTSYVESESDSDDISSLINHYFGTMFPILRAHGVYVMNKMGDGIYGVAGAPDPSLTHKVSTILAGLDMQKKMTEFPGLRLRVGINSGLLAVGMTGREGVKWTYDGLGRTVNIAQRAESAGAPGFVTATMNAMLTHVDGEGKHRNGRPPAAGGEWRPLEDLGDYFVTNAPEFVRMKGIATEQEIVKIHRLRRVTECPDRSGANPQEHGLHLTEDEVADLARRQLGGVDLPQVDAVDGDPLHTMTTAVIFRSVAKLLATSAAFVRFRDRAFLDQYTLAALLNEAGKPALSRSLLNDLTLDPATIVMKIRRATFRQIEREHGDLRAVGAILSRVFASDAGQPEDRVLKSAIIYSGVVVPKIYRRAKAAGRPVTCAEVFAAQGIPGDITMAYESLGLDLTRRSRYTCPA